MKILYVNNATVSSGAEDHLEDVATWLKSRGHEPAFLVSVNSVLSRQMKKIGIPYHEVFDRSRRLSIPWRIGKALIAEQPDIISINREHNILPTLLATWFASPWLKKKPLMVAVFHTPTGRRHLSLKLFDGVIATSAYTGASYVRTNPVIEPMLEIIHYGVRLPTIDETEKMNRNRPRRYFRDRGFPIIAMVGELWKNQEELVNAAPAMLEAFPDMTIAFVGGYGENDSVRLKAEIARLGLQKHFLLTGRIPRASIPDVFHDLDLSVSTHRNEGFGIVHIESMASLTPVVAYNNGGIVEILQKGGGVLVDGGIPEFAQAVVKLLSDDELRFRMGMEGRKVVEDHFSVDAMGKNHLRFYENLLAKKP